MIYYLILKNAILMEYFIKVVCRSFAICADLKIIQRCGSAVIAVPG